MTTSTLDRPPPRTARTLPASANGWKYLPQLDGLRALAVYLVVAFHAGFEAFEGGFIGVDLFFVLSGFLVTTVILSDIHEAGHLRLRRFYARRVRRLLPAATVTILGTALVSVMAATPLERAGWADDAQASSLWYANWHFLGEANDYFEADDAESPFLHFWSLAIEEQFYLIFPLLLILLWKLTRHRLEYLVATIGALTVVGLGVQIAWAGTDANRAYLGTDARAYQLLAGVLLALVIWRWPIHGWFTRRAPVLSAALVTALVLAGTSLLGVSVSTRGIVAAVISVGTILAVQTATSGPTHRLLSAGPIQYLGQISYGTYLWHWPVVILADHMLDLTNWWAFLLSAVLGTALAALSARLVETPLRRNKMLDRMPISTIVGGVTVAAVSGIVLAPALLERDDAPITNASSSVSVETGSGTATVTLDDGPLVQTVPDLDWVAVQDDRPDFDLECDRADAQDCILIDGDSGSILLIGDSHARVLTPALTDIAERHDLQLAMAMEMGCPWYETGYVGNPDNNKATVQCIETRGRTYSEILPALDPDIVIVAGVARTAEGKAPLQSTRDDVDGLTNEQMVERLAIDTVTRLVDEGRNVVMIEPTPIFEEDPLACLSGATTAAECTTPALLTDVEETVYRSLDDQYEAAVSVDLDGHACPRLPVCDPLQRDYPVWRDHNHFTKTWMTWATPLIENELESRGVLDIAP